MSKLFRRVRKDLIEETASSKASTGKKTTKYIKYAIGEILLVVIGILIALSINNWNEKRKENDLKDSYSLRLVNDLKKDIISIEVLKTRTEEMQSIISKFTKSLDSEIIMTEKIDITEKYFTEGWSILGFASQKNTYTDLSQTGNMKVFKDTDVREEILSYYSLVANYLNVYEINKDWVLPLDVVISQETNALGFSDSTKDLYNLQDKAKAIGEFETQKELLKRHASVHYWKNTSSLSHLNKIQQTAEELIKSLE